ncbi:hypothetical protein [Halochromatium sp.]
MSIIRPLMMLMIAPLMIAEIGAAGLGDQREEVPQVEQPAHSQASAHPRTGSQAQETPKSPPYRGRTAPALGQPVPMPAPGLVMEPRRLEPSGSQSQVPRWLEEVRAQRRALREQRRAAHKARLEALDPIGTAKRDERKELIRRRQEEMRDLIESERLLYLNRGPWISPLAPRPPLRPKLDPLAGGSLDPQQPEHGEQQPTDSTDSQAPSDWNNLWYYRGW